MATYTAYFHPRIIGLTGSASLIARAAQNFNARRCPDSSSARASATCLACSAACRASSASAWLRSGSPVAGSWKRRCPASNRRSRPSTALCIRRSVPDRSCTGSSQ
nr:SCO family protein [Thiocapsa sp.]